MDQIVEKRIYINVEGKLLDSRGDLIDPLEFGNCLNELNFIQSVAIQRLSKSPLKVFALIRETNQGSKRTLGRIIFSKLDQQQFNFQLGSIEIYGLPMFPSSQADSSLDWSMFDQLQSYRLVNGDVTNETDKSKVQLDVITSWSKYLNIPPNHIDLNDNLFSIGGNLFIAGRIAYQLYQQNYPITLEDLIADPTVGGITAKIEVSLKKGIQPVKPIPRMVSSSDRERKSLLSWTQRWVFVHEQLMGKGNFYFLDVSYQIAPGFTYSHIESVINQLVSSVELLRSFVRVRGSSHLLTIAPSRQLTIPVIKVSNDEDACRSIEEKKETLNIIANDDSFLFDVIFLESPEVNCFTLFIHHLIADDLSYLMLEEKLYHLLQAAQSGNELKPTLEPVDYVDYTVWVTQEIQRKDEIIDPLEEYWLDRLKDLPNCRIPVNFDEKNPPTAPKVSGKHSLISLTCDETNGAKALIRSVGTTFDILAEAVIKVILYKLTGVGDTIVKRMISARLHPMSYEMIGHFNNMFYSRTSIRKGKNGGPTFTDLLKDFHSSWLADFNCRGYPWINTLAQTNVEHVCPAGISIIGLPEERFVDNDELSVKIFKVDQFQQVSFELMTCIFGIHEGKLHYCLNYNQDLLEPEAITTLVNTFDVFLRRVVTYSDRPIDDYFNIEPVIKLTQWPQQDTNN